MRKNNENWILVKDKRIFQLDDAVDMISGHFGEAFNCNGCNELIILSESKNWEAYLKQTKVLPDAGGGYYIQTKVEFYCSGCSSN